MDLSSRRDWMKGFCDQLRRQTAAYEAKNCSQLTAERQNSPQKKSPKRRNKTVAVILFFFSSPALCFSLLPHLHGKKIAAPLSSLSPRRITFTNTFRVWDIKTPLTIFIYFTYRGPKHSAQSQEVDGGPSDGKRERERETIGEFLRLLLMTASLLPRLKPVQFNSSVWAGARICFNSLHQSLAPQLVLRGILRRGGEEINSLVFQRKINVFWLS